MKFRNVHFKISMLVVVVAFIEEILFRCFNFAVAINELLKYSPTTQNLSEQFYDLISVLFEFKFMIKYSGSEAYVFEFWYLQTSLNVFCWIPSGLSLMFIVVFKTFF